MLRELGVRFAGQTTAQYEEQARRYLTGALHPRFQRRGRVRRRRGRGRRQAARFGTIAQDWLRDPVKRWSGPRGGPVARRGCRGAAGACDLTAEALPQRLVDAAVERYGRLDIVINNAGIIQVGPVQAAQLSHYEDAVQTMALAPVRLALTALPVMQRQGHGRIVTIASIGGKLGVPHLLPYSTAKFAAVGFLRRAARRTRPPPGDGYHRRTRAYAQRRPSAAPFHRAGREGVHLVRARRQPAVAVDGRRAGRPADHRGGQRPAGGNNPDPGRPSRLPSGRSGARADQRDTAHGPAADAARGGRPSRSRNPRRDPRTCAEPGHWPGRPSTADRPRPGRGGPLQRAAPAVTGRPGADRQRSGADDLLRGSDPEFFEQVCLAPRPGHELVEVPGVQPPVRVR